MQATCKAIRTARTLVELAACVQLGEHNLHDGQALFRMNAVRDTAPVVFHADRAVRVQREGDAFAKVGQCLVGGVVQHFLDHVQWMIRAGVHAWTLLDGL